MDNTVALKTAEPRQSSLLTVMAAKYHMDPKTFADTVRKTAMPANATNEEFAAFMMVAQEYNLNPILKEIHAFPKKGGGIQPVVSIDGWVSLVNQHPQCDGYNFDWEHDDKGAVVSCKCTMYRKDRDHPVVVEEYLVECKRQTDPWKMEHRMLRHRALIQAARYAFGFTGVMDPDEAETIANMRDITPLRPQMKNFTGNAPAQVTKSEPTETVNEETGEITTEESATADPRPEFGTADAYDMGREARRQKKALKAVPPEWRDGKSEPFVDAWTEGWKAEDEELGGK